MSAAAERLLGLLAAVSLEAGWIVLLYVVVEGLAGAGFVPLTAVHVGLAAALGLAMTRLGRRLPDAAHAVALAVLVVGVALVGWLLPVDPGLARLASDPVAVLGDHPGGLLLGLAVLRGAAHGREGGEEAIAERALGPGLVGIAAAWLALTISGISQHADLTAIAFAATVTFVTAALVAIGVARLDALRSLDDPTMRRRSWLSLLFGVIVAMLALAIPLAAVVGVPASAAVYGVLGPVGAVLAALLTLIAIPLFAVTQLLPGMGPNGQPTGLPPIPPLPTVADIFGPQVGDQANGVGFALGTLPILLAVILAVVIVRSLIHRPEIAEVDRDVEEVREVELVGGGPRIALPHLRRTRRGASPRDALEAYVAAIEVLAGEPRLARRPAETPLEHARRIDEPVVRRPLGRLATDYVLGSFAGRRLTTREHRRAIARWNQLRSLLRH